MLERFYELLEAGIGFSRARHPALEQEAAERAYEARQQVGLHATGTSSDLIVHPSQMERESRLGPEWAGKGVAEVATWLYQWNDPIKALVDSQTSSGTKVGLLNSEPHNTILRDVSFPYWGAGIYTELPPGEPEINRRYYAIVWLSKGVPLTETHTFTDVPPSHRFHDDIEWAAQAGIALGSGGKFNPDAPATRAHVIAFLRRLHTHVKSGG